MGDTGPVEPAVPKLLTRELIALDNAELDSYLAKHVPCPGEIAVLVSDPENLNFDVVRRVSDRRRLARIATLSRVVDLDQVNARLLEPPDKNKRKYFVPSSRTSPIPDDERVAHQELVDFETKCYAALLEDGGRPSHPLSRLEDIARDPGDYRAILSFWQSEYPGEEAEENDWMVFSQQLDRWNDFLRLQRYARGQSQKDYWRSVWELEGRVESFKPENRRVEWDHSDAGWEAAYEKLYKHRQGRLVLVSGENRPWSHFIECEEAPEHKGFPEYVQALYERLQKHGFPREFQLGWHARLQDRLTTWIEYFAYECWWYDEYHLFLIAYRYRKEVAWAKIRSESMLEPGETEEDILKEETLLRGEEEMDRAEQIKKAAYNDIETPPQPYSECDTQAQSERSAMLSKYEAAAKAFERTVTRHGLIKSLQRRTKDWQLAERKATHQRNMVRWAIQQIPLIEAEMAAAKEPTQEVDAPAQKEDGNDGGGRKRKRKRTEDLD